MIIKEIGEAFWQLEFEDKVLTVHPITEEIFLYRTKTNFVGKSKQEIVRKWAFRDAITAEDLLLVIMKSHHL
jgi:hypothetical protein